MCVLQGQFPNALRVSLKELQKSDLKSVLSILQSDHEHDIRKLGDNFQVINSEEKRIYGNMKRRRRLVSCLIGNYDSLEPNLIDQFPIQKVKSKYVYSITNKGEMIGDSQVYTYASDIKLNNDQVCNAVARQQFGLNGYMDLNELMQFNIIEDELKIDEQKTIMDYEVGSTSVQYSSIFGEADWNDKNNSNCGGNFVRAHGLIDDSTQSITIGELSKKLSSRAYYMVLPNGRVFSQKRSSNHRLKQQKPIFAYLNNNFVYAIETPRIQQLVSAGRNILSLKKSHINPKDKFTVLPDYKFDKKEAMNFRQIIITKQNLNKVILKNMRDKNIFPDAISSDGVSITLARYANHILFANPDYERNCGLMHKIRETVSESLAATIDVHLNSTADIINLLLEHVTEHENWKSELNEHTYEIINQLPKKFADMRKDYINSFNLEKHVYCINNYLQHVMVNRLQGWPVYCRSDQPMEYDNSEIRPGAYHLKTRIEFMPQIYLTGWQDSILIEYMLQEKLISKSDIDYMLKAKYGLAHDIFEKIYKQIAITSEEMESFLCCKNVTKNMNTAFLSTSSCLRNTKEFANYRYANISSEKPVYVFYLDEKMESLCNFRPMYKSVIGSIFVLIRQLFFTVKSENSQLLAITGNSIIITRPNKDADMRVSLDSGKYRKKDAVPLKWHLPFHWWSDITPENPEEYEYLEQFQKPHIYIKPKFVEYNQESKSGKEAIEYKLNYMQANILDHYNANEIVSLKKLDGFRIKPFVRISKKGSKYLLAVIHKSNLARKQITKYFVIPKRTARIRMLLLNLQNYLKGVYNNEMNDQIDSFFKSARYNELRDICFEYSKNNIEGKFEMQLNL